MRFEIGAVRYHKTGIYFQEDLFRDGQASKWLHLQCRPAIMPAYLGSEDTPCQICGQQYYPEESVLRIREGQWGPDGLDTTLERHGHFNCLCDEWDIQLWDVKSDW